MSPSAHFELFAERSAGADREVVVEELERAGLELQQRGAREAQHAELAAVDSQRRLQGERSLDRQLLAEAQDAVGRQQRRGERRERRVVGHRHAAVVPVDRPAGSLNPSEVGEAELAAVEFDRRPDAHQHVLPQVEQRPGKDAHESGALVGDVARRADDA